MSSQDNSNHYRNTSQSSGSSNERITLPSISDLLYSEFTPPVRAPSAHPPSMRSPFAHLPPLHVPSVHPPPIHVPTAHPPPMRAPSMNPPPMRAPTAHPPSVRAPPMNPPPMRAPSMNPPSVRAPSAHPPSVRSQSAHPSSVRSPSARPPSVPSPYARPPPARSPSERSPSAASASGTVKRGRPCTPEPVPASPYFTLLKIEPPGQVGGEFASSVPSDETKLQLDHDGRPYLRAMLKRVDKEILVTSFQLPVQKSVRQWEAADPSLRVEDKYGDAKYLWGTSYDAGNATLLKWVDRELVKVELRLRRPELKWKAYGEVDVLTYIYDKNTRWPWAWPWVTGVKKT